MFEYRRSNELIKYRTYFKYTESNVKDYYPRYLEIFLKKFLFKLAAPLTFPLFQCLDISGHYTMQKTQWYQNHHSLPASLTDNCVFSRSCTTKLLVPTGAADLAYTLCTVNQSAPRQLSLSVWCEAQLRRQSTRILEKRTVVLCLHTTSPGWASDYWVRRGRGYGVHLHLQSSCSLPLYLQNLIFETKC